MGIVSINTSFVKKNAGHLFAGKRGARQTYPVRPYY